MSVFSWDKLVQQFSCKLDVVKFHLFHKHWFSRICKVWQNFNRQMTMLEPLAWFCGWKPFCRHIQVIFHFKWHPKKKTRILLCCHGDSTVAVENGLRTMVETFLKCLHELSICSQSGFLPWKSFIEHMLRWSSEANTWLLEIAGSAGDLKTSEPSGLKARCFPFLRQWRWIQHIRILVRCAGLSPCCIVNATIL